MSKEDFNKELIMLPLSQIEPNTGQLDGLSQNPRSIKKAKFEKLKKNIEEYPEMLAWRSLLVYPIGKGKYIIIGGNMRYKAMQELGHTEAPVFIIPADTPVERLKAYTIIDNNGFGDWNWDLLANEWSSDLLADWGIDLNFNLDDEPSDDELDGDDRNKPFTAKLTFSSETMLKKFIKEQEQMLADNYNCSVSYSGGEL